MSRYKAYSEYWDSGIVWLGRVPARDATTQPHNDLPRLKVFGYEALVSSARTQLDWLLRQLADS